MKCIFCTTILSVFLIISCNFVNGEERLLKDAEIVKQYIIEENDSVILGSVKYIDFESSGNYMLISDNIGGQIIKYSYKNGKFIRLFKPDKSLSDSITNHMTFMNKKTGKSNFVVLPGKEYKKYNLEPVSVETLVKRQVYNSEEEARSRHHNSALFGLFLNNSDSIAYFVRTNYYSFFNAKNSEDSTIIGDVGTLIVFELGNEKNCNLIYNTTYEYFRPDPFYISKDGKFYGKYEQCSITSGQDINKEWAIGAYDLEKDSAYGLALMPEIMFGIPNQFTMNKILFDENSNGDLLYVNQFIPKIFNLNKNQAYDLKNIQYSNERVFDQLKNNDTTVTTIEMFPFLLMSFSVAKDDGYVVVVRDKVNNGFKARIQKYNSNFNLVSEYTDEVRNNEGTILFSKYNKYTEELVVLRQLNNEDILVTIYRI